jgi:hypothetical protein
VTRHARGQARDPLHCLSQEDLLEEIVASDHPDMDRHVRL